jgi:tRNA-intron endonuclease
MDGTFADGVVRVGGDARQRFYDAHGYGRPLDRNRIELAPVEAAHLLSRGDLDAVVESSAAGSGSDTTPDADAGSDTEDDRLDFRAFLARTGTALRFTVYKDLRDRGFYLSPARPEWPGAGGGSDTGPEDGNSDQNAASDAPPVDFVVYPRGKGPWDDAVAHRVRVVGEREGVAAASLGGVVLAVVDEDGELTYFETDANPEVGADDAAGDRKGQRDVGADADLPGSVDADLPGSVDADLLDDRVVCYEAAEALYESRFYGQRLFGRNAEAGPLQLSLVEAAYLAQRGALAVDPEAVVDRAHNVEGERFDRRLRVYAALRGRGVVPKSGFKFGADFRVYRAFSDVDSLGHSADLVRVVGPDHTVSPRDLSLDVRLAGGVRKRMVFARTAANGRIRWLSVARITL